MTPFASPRLVLRYWTKLVLGSFSFAYIAFSGRRQALHDRLFGTLVSHVPAGVALAGWSLIAPLHVGRTRRVSVRSPARGRRSARALNRAPPPGSDSPHAPIA